MFTDCTYYVLCLLFTDSLSNIVSVVIQHWESRFTTWRCFSHNVTVFNFMVFKVINDKLGKVCRELIHSLQNRAGSDYNDRMVRYQRSSAVEQRHYESSISGWLINFLHLLAECSASFSPGNGKFQRPTFLLSDFSIELTIHLLLHLKFTHFWIMRLMKNCLIQKLCGLIQIV